MNFFVFIRKVKAFILTAGVILGQKCTLFVFKKVAFVVVSLKVILFALLIIKLLQKLFVFLQVLVLLAQLVELGP